MPRLLRRINITGQIRKDLRCGLSIAEAQRHAQQLTDRPESWSGASGYNYIMRIGNGLSPIDSSLRETRLAENARFLVANNINSRNLASLNGLVNATNNEVIDTRFNQVRRSRSRLTPVTPEATDDTTENSVFEVNVGNFDIERTFGIEIEFLIPETLSHEKLAKLITQAGVKTKAESYSHDENVRNNRGESIRHHWKIISDSSVVSHISNYNGRNEIVSPILKGEEGLKAIETVCKVLTENGIKVNKTCGLHVHHGCKNIPGSNVEAIARNAMVLYHKYQSKFDKIMPKSRRNNRFAKNLTNSEIATLRGGRLQCTTNRFKTVNIESYWRHGTVEFRQHSGTVEVAKIINWVKLTQSIMNRAKEIADANIDIWNHQFRKFEIELNFNAEIKTYVKKRFEKFAVAA